MLLTPEGIVMLLNSVQYSNAAFPMLVTLPGIVTPAKLVQSANTPYPMLVTVRLLMVLGMIGALPDPR